MPKSSRGKPRRLAHCLTNRRYWRALRGLSDLLPANTYRPLPFRAAKCSREARVVALSSKVTLPPSICSLLGSAA